MRNIPDLYILMSLCIKHGEGLMIYSKFLNSTGFLMFFTKEQNGWPINFTNKFVFCPIISSLYCLSMLIFVKIKVLNWGTSDLAHHIWDIMQSLKFWEVYCSGEDRSQGGLWLGLKHTGGRFEEQEKSVYAGSLKVGTDLVHNHHFCLHILYMFLAICFSVREGDYFHDSIAHFAIHMIHQCTVFILFWDSLQSQWLVEQQG